MSSRPPKKPTPDSSQAEAARPATETAPPAPWETAPAAAPSPASAAAPSPAAPWETAPPARAGHSRLRRNLRWELVGVGLVVAIVAGLIVGQRLLTSPDSGNTKTIWQTITAGIKDSGVPKDVALEAFAYQFKVSIPGVTVPSGVDGGDVPSDGSGSLRWVQANWNALTPDQQAVVNRFITPGPNDVVLHVDATKGYVAPTSTIAGPVLAAVQAPPIGGAGAAGAPAPGLQTALEAEFAKDIQHIGDRLKLPVITPGFGLWRNSSLTLSDQDGGNTLMLTEISENGIGHVTPCDVTVYKQTWQGETPTSGGGVSDKLHVLMTHEVIHCYQNEVFGDVDTSKAMASWISEGTAFWMAASDTGIQEPSTVSQWEQGYFNPETPLTNRSYDAVGYYALLDHLGRDLWSRMVPAWTAAATNAQRSNAFIAVLQGDDQDVRDSWATSYLRQTPWGDPWIMYGFGLPDAAQVFQHPVTATSSGYQKSQLGRSNTVLSVNAADGEIVGVVTSGLASAHDASGSAALSFQTKRFCVSGDCVCPAGTTLAGQKMADQSMTMPFSLAMNAPFGGADFAVASFKLDELCQKQSQPSTKPVPQKPSPCAGQCSNSNGDPHLLTINNYRYDFQGAGEFTLLRSADGKLEVQARQEPYHSSTSVATNTAVAARVGSHRVAFYATDAGIETRLDGKVLDLAKPTDLGGGNRIASYPKGAEIDFADGTRMWALSVAPYGINALISPSDSLRASGTGLLGRVIPGGLGVPTLPDGTRLPIAKDAHERFTALYGRYADAWRVTDSTTLFDYDSGKSTATYTIKGFPAEKQAATFDTLTTDQRAAGDAACGAITDQQLHDDCVFDVGVTGDGGFAGGYKAAVALFEVGIATGPTSSPGPVSSATPAITTGVHSLGAMNALAGYAFGSADRVYVSVTKPDGTASLMLVDLITGAVVAQVPTTRSTEVHYAATSVWVPGLKTDANGHTCNVTRFDGASLAELATIDVPCGFFDSPETVSDGSALWFVDVTKYDGTTNKGAVLTRIDPSTNAPDPTSSVPIPFINGYRRDGNGVIFYFDTAKESGIFSLKSGDTSLQRLADWSVRPVFSGTGVWTTDSTAHTIQFISSSGSAAAPLQVNDSVIAGDANAAYVEVQAPGNQELWRYPTDGSTPTKLVSNPTIDGQEVSFFGDPQALVGTRGLVKFWLLRPDSGGDRTLYFVYVPLS